MYENLCTISYGLRETINRRKHCVGVLFSYTEVMTDDGVQGVGVPHFYSLIIVVRSVGTDHTVPTNNRRTRVHSVHGMIILAAQRKRRIRITALLFH